MKILLDESLPRKLKNDFGTVHEVWSTKDKGWLGKKNGELLKLLSENGFHLFVTIDRNLQYQQNLTQLPVMICVLCAKDNRYETLKSLIPKMFDVVQNKELNGVIEISL